MTREEFARVAAVLTLGTGKPLTTDAAEVYFDCLGDLSFDVAKIACKRVLMEHKWATFPSIAELRQAAAETTQGTVKELGSGEAWSLAWRAVGQIDPEVSGSYARGVEGLPPLVIEAMEVYGINPLCYGKEPVGVIRAQFTKIYDQLADRDRRRSLMPPKLTQQIEAQGRQVVSLALRGIGDGHLRSDAGMATAVPVGRPGEKREAEESTA